MRGNVVGANRKRRGRIDRERITIEHQRALGNGECWIQCIVGQANRARAEIHRAAGFTLEGGGCYRAAGRQAVVAGQGEVRGFSRYVEGRPGRDGNERRVVDRTCGTQGYAASTDDRRAEVGVDRVEVESAILRLGKATRPAHNGTDR